MTVVLKTDFLNTKAEVFVYGLDIKNKIKFPIFVLVLITLCKNMFK